MNNEQNFIEWLKQQINKGELSNGTSEEYQRAINTITKELKERKLLENEIYSIDDIDEVKKIIKVYLEDKTLKEKDERCNNKYSCALKKYMQFLKVEPKYNYDDNSKKISIIEIEKGLDKMKSTERLIIIAARIGQSKFKKELLERDKECLLCGIKTRELLIASHIKPWSESDDNEKLNPSNGLLLCCLHDKLFDLGFISFDVNGKILISDEIDESLYNELKINTEQIIRLNDSNIAKYLDWKNKRH